MPKNGIHHDLDVMAGRGVTMQVNRAGGLQNHLHVQQPLYHVGEIGQETRLGIAERVHPQPPELYHVVLYAVFPHKHGHSPERALPAFIQRPQVTERLYLVRQGSARLVLVNGVVLPVGIERRVQVDEINGTRLHALHDSQVIPEV